MSVTALTPYRNARRARVHEAVCPELACGYRLYRPSADEAELEMATHRLQEHATEHQRAAIAAELETLRVWLGELPLRLVHQLVIERLAGRAGYTANVDERFEGVAA